MEAAAAVNCRGLGSRVSGLGWKMKNTTYQKLDVWQQAITLVEEVYKLTTLFPESEKYGLKSQMQRCAVSVPANIAEGYGRTHRGDYLRHLSIARGSLMELETHLTLSARLKLVDRKQVLESWRKAQLVGKMLTRLIASLSTPDPRPKTPDPKS